MIRRTKVHSLQTLYGVIHIDCTDEEYPHYVWASIVNNPAVWGVSDSDVVRMSRETFGLYYDYNPAVLCVRRVPII